MAPPLDRAALIVADRVITYADLAERVDRWRGALVDAGHRPGDRVVLLAGNNESFVVAYLAALTAGLVTIPLNPMSPGPELRREVDLVEPSVLIVGHGGESAFESLTAAVDGQSLGGVTVHRADSLESAGAVAPRTPVVDVDGDAPAVLLFTSGTAGASKPAILTHANLRTSLQSMVMVSPHLTERHHVALGIIPLFHVFGLNVIVNLGLFVGATIVLEDHMAPARTAELVARHGITIVAGPPTLWQALANDDDIGADAFATVVVALSGAAKLSPVVNAAVQSRLGIEVSEGYGLTETCSVATASMGSDAPIGSVGPLVPGIEARLLDTDGNPVLVGDAGEVWLRGPMVSPGYWDDPDATRRTRDADGWFRTGDLAVVDDDGNLSILDRVKDLIIVSGFNVHPAEVELVLTARPEVASAGVIGEPDSMTGERIVAHLVPADGASIDEAAIREHCRAQLARYKVPKRFVVAGELPISVIGKLRRRELHDGAR